MLWDDGSETWEDLRAISKDDPVTIAGYAKANELLDTPGWKRFKRLAQREKKYVRMLRQANLSNARHAPKYKFGIRVPRNYKEAVKLDEQNGNTFWQDAIKKEMSQIIDYKTFKDNGRIDPAHGIQVPNNYTLIRCHLIFDVKFDLRRKS